MKLGYLVSLLLIQICRFEDHLLSPFRMEERVQARLQTSTLRLLNVDSIRVHPWFENLVRRNVAFDVSAVSTAFPKADAAGYFLELLRGIKRRDCEWIRFNSFHTSRRKRLNYHGVR